MPTSSPVLSTPNRVVKTASFPGVAGSHRGLSVSAVLIGFAIGGCSSASAPAPDDRRLFTDDFAADMPEKWTPYAGAWNLEGAPGLKKSYAAPKRILNQAVAGSQRWTDYQVQARVTLRDDLGKVGLLGRVEGSHHYYEYLLGRDGLANARSWIIRRRIDHEWQTLASGPFDYEIGVPYVMRFNLRGARLEAHISTDEGATFTELGVAGDDRLPFGRIGVASYFTSAAFADVSVEGSPLLALESGPWGPIAMLRDNTNTFATGKPAGGWYVTGIHGTLRASDGRVLITGFGRRGATEAECDAGATRQVGITFLLDPAQIDALDDGDTLLVQPLNEQNRDPKEVLYCAGHNTLADGRIFFTGGTNYPSTLPNGSPELGVSYVRTFSPVSNTFTRLAAAMKGGQSSSPGMKWYPTNTLMPDGTVLTFGGFHWYSGGPGTSRNLSLELFNPKITDANPSADPFTVLTQHAEGQADTAPTRGYTNMFVLPKPVPAGSANGLARSVGLVGGQGRVYLFNHEPGPSGAARLLARPNGQVRPTETASEKFEGASGVLLPDGRMMFANGGHAGANAAAMSVYNPYTDQWGSTIPTGISRIYANAVWLPNGQILLINGYVSEKGSDNDVVSPLGAPNGVRTPQLIDPFGNRLVTPNPAPWPEPTGRGYHSFALLLKDGRVLISGGKDADHQTGCEKNEVRIYSPPYLSAGPRPAITNVASGRQLAVGSGSFTINYSGTVRGTRGVVLMAPGSVTHAFDMGQRFVPLTATSGPSAGTVTVALPASINEAPPGDYLLYVVSDLGVPSVGVHVRLTPPPTCVFPVSATADAYIEAENSSRRAGPFQRMSDAARSGGAFMEVTATSGSTTTVPDEGKVMWYDLNVTSGGSFFLWGLANGPSTTADSFYLSVDGNADVLLTDFTVNAWGWKRSASALNLSTGKHTLKIKVREAGAKLDKIRLTTSTSTTAPTGLGGAALACNDTGGPSGGLVSALVVNDTANGGDGIPNNTQWSVQSNFAAGQTAFGDRTYTIGTLPTAAAHFTGKPWIRTANDSRASTANPIATAKVDGSFVFIAADNRLPTEFLTTAGYVSQGYSFPVNEGTIVRTFNVWRRAVTPGSTVPFPPTNSGAGSFYLIIVE